MKLSGVSRAALVVALLAGPLSGAAFAQATPEADEQNKVFVLGRMDSIAGTDGQAINVSSISGEEMRDLDRATVDEAVDLIPGANSSNTGGSRNERLIFVRGFDRFQTTLSMDGVRVYLPADNRIDFGRFLSSDLAEVQVSKGYVSVLNGPGGLGGAVNLVTRRPTQPFEAELIAGVTTDGEFGTNSNFASGLLGTANDQFYAQLSGAWQDRDSWSMSDDFVPVQPTLEDGGERGNSASEDWRVNLKAGWTPNDTDEYALSYLKSSGEKNAPYHIADTASTRFWTWPYWDLESVYFLSRTQLGDNLQLRSRVYWNTFQNLLSSFDSAAQNTQTLPRAFDSYYDDVAYGGNVTLENKYSEDGMFTVALHYRKDEHNEQQDGFIRTPATGNPFVNAPYSEPWQTSIEDTYSIALENVNALTENIDITIGASYEWTHLFKAQDVNVSAGGTAAAPAPVFTPVSYPLKDMDAINYQGALIWHLTDSDSLHASVSSRTRFPTLFERFSSRFGTAIPNPDIEPERALNFEVGGHWVAGSADIDAAVFYTDFDDALVQVPVNLGAPFGVVNQTRNLGNAYYLGGEISVRAQLADNIEAGGNLTLIQREYDTLPPPYLDATNFFFEPQGVPESRLFLYADWEVIPRLRIIPSVEVAGDRWTVQTNPPLPLNPYYKTGAYGLVNLSVSYDITDNVSVLLAGKNLTDRNYALVDGFPEEGRNFALSLKYRN